MFEFNSGKYDFVLNLSALKHVRRESDPFTLMRLIRTNVINTVHTVKLAAKHDVGKYFYISTDKAANPVNMMGASVYHGVIPARVKPYYHFYSALR